MTREEIDEMLKDLASWRAPPWADRRQKFCERMENRQYGQDALRSAWAWFNQGWEDCFNAP